MIQVHRIAVLVPLSVGVVVSICTLMIQLGLIRGITKRGSKQSKETAIC